MSSLSIRELRGRALRLRCPVCGQGPLFASWWRMHPRCTTCGFTFERESGYFLGSIYLNYGVAAGAAFGLYFGLYYGAGWSLSRQWPLLLAVPLVLGLWFFRYARALWLAFDLSFDPPRPEEFIAGAPRP